MSRKNKQKSNDTLQWLFSNMRGMGAIYIFAMFLPVVYNVLHLVVPIFSQKLIDIFLSGDQAAENIKTKLPLFWGLVVGMVLFTLIRTIIVYLTCMLFEKVSQETMVRIRSRLFHKILHQDMKF